MADPNRITGRVRAVGRGGDAIIETDGGVIIAPGGLPEERVTLVRSASRRGAARGRILQVIEASESRTEARSW